VTVRLRAHHLLCLLTYVGKGYTPAFTANYDAVVARLDAGEDVLVVEGPDDICAPMLAEGHHCLNASITDRDRQAADAVAALLERPFAAGMTLALDSALVRLMRSGFAANATRQACTGCEWSALCTGIAGGAFAGTRLRGA
jgi:hypothetical protein